jgi:hypothetical protein
MGSCECIDAGKMMNEDETACIDIYSDKKLKLNVAKVERKKIRKRVRKVRRGSRKGKKR